MVTLYMQTDKRWSSMPYGGGTTVGAAACGVFAIANMLQKDPMEIRQYMLDIGGASYDQGTYHWAITQCIREKYNVDAKKTTDSNRINKGYFYELKEFFKSVKDGFKGILLMGNGNSIYKWTSSGHYIAITEYKEVNGIDMFYVMDSYYLKTNGWHPVSDFINSVKHIWITDSRWKDEEVEPKEVDEEMSTVFEGQKIESTFKWKAAVRTVTKDNVVVTDEYGKEKFRLKKGNKIRVILKFPKSEKYKGGLGLIAKDNAEGRYYEWGLMDCINLSE